MEKEFTFQRMEYKKKDNGIMVRRYNGLYDCHKTDYVYEYRICSSSISVIDIRKR